MLKEFKEFALRGNVLDMAVGIIVGAAFTKVVNSLVADIILPPINLVSAGGKFVDEFGITVNGVKIMNAGSFINATFQFTLTAFAVFLLVRAINKLRGPQPSQAASTEPATRECPYCLSAIPVKATRCGHCTSQMPPAAE